MDGSEKAPIATLYVAFSPDRAARLRFLIAVVRYFVTTSRLMSNFSSFRRRLKLIMSSLRRLCLTSPALTLY